ncbi:MAG: glutamine-hydrolyzing carbamoyl-phosphate synthase small subunit [Clostridiales bacterium]|nr:glutamine-hydrolyzing carbamoyl-phosphate synthase small subunit [Clostridiales bacterium]
MKGYLLLEDGTKFSGNIFGAINQQVGEVVFNTSMTGYQEIMTDPSYFNQIVVMTYPLIGNYGIHHFVNQSNGPIVKGFVVRESADIYTHWKGYTSLDAYLKKNGIIGISGVDTRAIVRIIREKGTLKGIIASDEVMVDDNLKLLKETEFNNYVQSVTTKSIYDMWPLGEPVAKVAVLDFGIKRNIIRELLKRNLQVRIFPAQTDFEAIKSFNPDGIFMSNGPGDPKEIPMVIKEVEKIIDSNIPTFGICLGHQLIALALGAETVPMKYGHRGGNHPVKDLLEDKIVITAQNHGYVVTDESLMAISVEITHRNINDRTIEGIKHKTKALFSVQYHPEASPGPDDSSYLFDQFLKMIEEQKG